VRDDAKPSPSFPPAEALVDALRERVTDAVVRSLDGALPAELLRERVGPAVSEALREHAMAVVDRLLRVERLAGAGQLSAGVAHELRNPLAVIETSLFILNERLASDPRAQRQLKRIGEQVNIATAIVNDLLETVRDRPIASEHVDLAAVARDALGRVPRPSNISVDLALPEATALVEGDPRKLAQVVVNLLSNAVQALSAASVDGPRLALSVAVDGEHALLRVDDNGHGIRAEALPRLFDPLFSTRPDGTGLGLALSRRIAESHGGTLTAENLAPRGARFTLRLLRRKP
jgi:two-component system, NtrC family, sensor histidine kinase HydH